MVAAGFSCKPRGLLFVHPAASEQYGGDRPGRTPYIIS
jgi:hypothetical protein